jgi:hypothetical protein
MKVIQNKIDDTVNVKEIATHLGVCETSIHHAIKWANVVYVYYKSKNGFRATFVSKKIALAPRVKIDRQSQDRWVFRSESNGVSSWVSVDKKGFIRQSTPSVGIEPPSAILLAIAESRKEDVKNWFKPEEKPKFVKRYRSLEYEMYNPNGAFYG